MTSPSLSDRDYELISAFLDGEVDARQKKDIEGRLSRDTQFRSAYEQMSRTRQLMRSQPLLRAPRTYTLSSKAIAALQPTKRALLSFPALLQTASAFASVVFLILFGLNWLTADRMRSAAPLASQEILLQSTELAPLELPSEVSQIAPAEEQPMAKSMPTVMPIQPIAPEIGGMGGGADERADSGVEMEAPLLEPSSGTELLAPTDTITAPARMAPLAIPGEGDVYSQQVPSEESIPESQDVSEFNETESLVRGLSQSWFIRQVLYGVLAIVFAIIAIRTGKRKD